MAIYIAAAACFLVYIVGLAVYRLYFSPIAHIPGPRIAAITSLYHAYYDLWRGGQYVFVVQEMHCQYGPVVRIRPDVVHVSDPRFIDKVYSLSTKQRRNRYKTVTQGMQVSGSVLGTQDHDLHSRRRAALSPFFSPANVRRLQPVIDETLRNLFNRMDSWAGSEPVCMNRAFRAATKDVIQIYAFGDGPRCLDMDDLNSAFFDILVPGRAVHFGTHFHAMATLLRNLPAAMMLRLMPQIGVFTSYLQEIFKMIEQVRGSKVSPQRRTIIHEILHNTQLPASEKETVRVADEAMVLIMAGSETTAATLTSITYELYSNPNALARLKAELAPVMASSDDNDNVPPDADKLDKLPYLNAVIEEGLRLYPGATHRQDRMAPEEDLVYHNPESGLTYTIPAGSAVGMTAPISNRDRTVWGDTADEFLPDRWLENPQLRRHLLSFSKGTRQCLGIHLAYREMQTFIAGLVHKYGVFEASRGEQGQQGPTLELYETCSRDVEMAADYVTPQPYEGSQGLRLVIRR